ncbi:MAG: TMEM165/GDT1 family protein [Mycobacteriales bacterium]
MWAAAGIAFGVVFLAELGDKSQLLVLSLASRFRRLPVLFGVSLAILLMQALSVVAGSLIADRVPQRPAEIVAGVLFLAFAAWTLRSGADADSARPAATGRSAVVASFAAFLAAEFGDKTMLATAALAANGDRLAVWLGSSAAMVLSATLAVLVGAALAKRVSERALQYAAAAAFVVVGVLLLAGFG